MVLVRDPEVDADKVLRLIRESEIKRDAIVKHILRMQEGTLGRAMGGAAHRKAEEPQNKCLSLYTLLLPQAIGGTPQVLIESERGTEEWLEARALEEALNVWGPATDLRSRLEVGFFDHFHGWAMSLIQMAPNANMVLTERERESLSYPLGPNAKRADGSAAYVSTSPTGFATPELPSWVPMPIDRCGWDMYARTEGEERHWWHQSTHDLDDLEELARKGDQGWRYPAVKALHVEREARALGKARHSRGQSNESIEDRNEVVLYNVWIPDGRIPGRTEPKHHRGIWMHIAAMAGGTRRKDQERALLVRDPEWCFAPPGVDGPYNRSGQYRSSMSSQPFSMVLANKDQIDLAQAVAAKLVNDLRKQKTRYAADSRAKPALDKMMEGPGDTIASIPGLSRGSGAIQRIDVYGLDAHTLAGHEWVEGVVDRSIALDSAQQGVAQESATATASGLAAASLEQRMRHMLQSFREWVARGEYKAAWMIAHNSRVIVRASQQGRADLIYRQQAQVLDQMPEVQQGAIEIPDRVLKRAAEKQARSTPVLVQGGGFAQSPNLDFLSLSLRIRPFSLRAEDDVGLRREALELLQIRAQLCANMIQFPHGDWIEEARRIGLLYGQPGWEKGLDAEKASMLAQIQVEGQGPDASIQTRGGVEMSRSGPQARIVNRTAPEPGQQAARALSSGGRQ